MDMVDLEKKEDLAVITLNNPPMNVLCTDLLNELKKTLTELEDEEDLRAVVITGKGRAFVAGADIDEMKGMNREEAEGYCELGQEVLNMIDYLQTPVIAAINGFALGGGTEVALACDIRIASTDAKFGQPEVNLGVIPGFGGTQRLSRAIGPGKAKELIYTGKIIDAETAGDIGLVQEVVDGDVMDRSVELAEEITKKGPLAVKNAKKAINKGRDTTLLEGLEKEKKGFSDLFSTRDQKEGMEAFLDKRKPDFKGE